MGWWYAPPAAVLTFALFLLFAGFTLGLWTYHLLRTNPAENGPGGKPVIRHESTARRKTFSDVDARRSEHQVPLSAGDAAREFTRLWVRAAAMEATPQDLVDAHTLHAQLEQMARKSPDLQEVP